MSDFTQRFEIVDDSLLDSTIGGFSAEALGSLVERTDWSEVNRAGLKAGGILEEKGGAYGPIIGAVAAAETGPLGSLAGAWAGYKLGRQAGFGMGYVAGAGMSVWNQARENSSP